MTRHARVSRFRFRLHWCSEQYADSTTSKAFRPNLPIELREQARDFRLEIRQSLCRGQTLRSVEASRAVGVDHDHFARFGQHEPDEGDAVREVPLCLVRERPLMFILAGNFDGKHGRNGADAASSLAGLRCSPHDRQLGYHHQASCRPRCHQR